MNTHTTQKRGSVKLFVFLFTFLFSNFIGAQTIKRVVKSTSSNKVEDDYYTKGYNYRKNGQNIIIEAENFESQKETSKRQWYVVSKTKKPSFKRDPDIHHLLGASNGKYLELLPDTLHDEYMKKVEGKNYSKTPGEVATLSYNVDFKSTGRYYVWIRGFSTSVYDNSIHVGLNNEWPESGKQLYLCKDLMNTWSWSSDKFSNSENCISTKRVYIDVKRPGPQKITFSMREDGFEFDKFLLTKSKDYKPR